jgi:hypothetical protein|tara:strand:- start:6588 stop:6707 length:120 start_codon:yes stop_codon:yes gene_type:complete
MKAPENINLKKSIKMAFVYISIVAFSGLAAIAYVLDDIK